MFREEWRGLLEACRIFHNCQQTLYPLLKSKRKLLNAEFLVLSELNKVVNDSDVLTCGDLKHLVKDVIRISRKLLRFQELSRILFTKILLECSTMI